MTRVLVSGGAGYVGRFIVEGLLGAGCAVTVGGRVPPAVGYFSEPVSFVPLHLDPSRDQRSAFDGIDHLVHAAFEHVEGRYRGGEGDDPMGFRHANLDGTVRIFEEARAAGVSRCVFLSSRAVYGTQPGTAALLDETVVAHPDTLYGTVKLRSEEGLAALSRPGFATASLRVTGVYGAAGKGKRHKWHGLFEDYLAGRPVMPRAGTEVHGIDVAKAVRLMLEAAPSDIDRQIFNVSDLTVDRRDLLAVVSAAAVCANPLPERAGIAVGHEMSTAKIRALGWQPGGWPLLEREVRALLT